MSSNNNFNLHNANRNKKDEFYTLYEDIEREINKYIEYDSNVFRDKVILLPCDDPEQSNFTKYFAQNFERFGIKKLISTSYAKNSKSIQHDLFSSILEKESKKYDKKKSDTNGKIFILERNKNKKVNINDLQWEYLKGDGDFRSEEVKKLRNESDIIVTNPPFSLFREFVKWIFEKNKKFLIIGELNCITYKEIYPLIKSNKLWCGNGFNESYIFQSVYKNELESNKKFVIRKGFNPENGFIKVPKICWFTNLEHGRRHSPLKLMTMKENIKYNKYEYLKYDNSNAIEVSLVELIPNDYEDKMGVPITFIGKYCPEQFDIINFRKGDDGKDLSLKNKKEYPYFRILIKKKSEFKYEN